MRRVVRAQQQRFRISLRLNGAVEFLVEQIGVCPRLTGAPRVTGIPDDPQEPGAGVAAGKGTEVAERPQGRVLHDVFGVVIVSHEPARKPARRAKVRQHNIVEGLGRSRACVGRHAANVSEAARNGHRQRPHTTRTAPAPPVTQPHTERLFMDRFRHAFPAD